MKKKSVKINAFLNIFKTLLTIIFPLITFPYVSRVLQATNLGKAQWASSVVTYFTLFAGLGVEKYAIREGASYRDDKEKMEKFCSEIFSLNMITTFISYLGLFILLFVMKRSIEYKYLIVIYGFSILFTTLGVDWINTLYEDFFYITIRSIIIQILVLILTFLFIRNQDDYFIYGLISMFSSVGANIINFFYVRKYNKLKFTFKINYKKHLKPILLLFASSIATTIYNSSDTTMLGIMKSDYDVGIYYVGSKIYIIIKRLIKSGMNVTIPRLSYYKSHDMDEDYSKLLNNIFKLLIILVLPICLGLLILSKEIILIISGKSYLSATVPLQLLSIACLVAVFSYFLTDLVLIINKEDKKLSFANIVAAIVNFVLNLFFIKKWSYSGAAATTLIAEMVVVLISYIYSKKYLKITNVKRTLISSIVGCIFIYLYSLLIRFLNLSFYINFGLILVGSMLIYFLIIYFYNKTLCNMYIRKILKKIRRA